MNHTLRAAMFGAFIFLALTLDQLSARGNVSDPDRKILNLLTLGLLIAAGYGVIS